MKKVVFEGNINGKTFDNVQDYNAEMKRLLQSGETNITATSSTRAFDEPVNDKKAAEQETPFNAQDYLIFFDNSCEQYYLDALVSNDHSLNQRSLDRAGAAATDALEKLERALKTNKLSVDEVFGFVNVLKDIRSRITQDFEENRIACNDLQERIAQDQKKLELLQNAKPVINTLSEYYDKAFQLVKNYLLNL